jgi:hypothetical protein
MALQSLVFEPLNETLQTRLSGITLQEILDFSDKQKTQQAFMLNL